MKKIEIKEKLIVIVLILFGLQNTISGVYNTIYFDSLHIIPGMLYLIHPSPTYYYIPLILLGFTCIISGILIIKKRRLATYISNIALTGLIINSCRSLIDFEIDFIIWIITSIIVLSYSIIYINNKEFKNTKQISLKVMIVIIGLILIYLGPVLI